MQEIAIVDSNYFGQHLARTSRPTIFLHCCVCNRTHGVQKLRGKFIGQISVPFNGVAQLSQVEGGWRIDNFACPKCVNKDTAQYLSVSLHG